jgi:hypothetical protein
MAGALSLGGHELGMLWQMMAGNKLQRARYLENAQRVRMEP